MKINNLSGLVFFVLGWVLIATESIIILMGLLSLMIGLYLYLMEKNRK